MKFYSATITVTIGLQAPNEEKAQERAEMIADRLIVGPENPAKWPDYQLPRWYDATGYAASVEDVTDESE